MADTQPSAAASVFARVPYKTICITNLGQEIIDADDTLDRLQRVFGGYPGYERVVLKAGVPYAFVVFRDSSEAKVAHAATHSKPCVEFTMPLHLEYLTHQNFVRLVDGSSKPPAEPETLDESHGLYYIPSFISAEEEQQIMQNIRMDEQNESASSTNPDKWYRIQERYIKHYGHSFDYKRKHVGSASMTASTELPRWLQPYIDRLCQLLPPLFARGPPDQITIQRYPPGAGIAFHTDSHSAFTETLVSLSMGTPVHMEFRKLSTGGTAMVDLEPGSLVVMTGEARYGWEHAIRIRRTDPVEGGVRPRQERWSITMRTINRELACECSHLALCDADTRLVQQLRRDLYRHTPA
ncbi:hypothetical protein GGI07_005155 [Coemansia sp. Benny D115]|nr:hypothetical protein GGI07_005155 [Coemansia sp. Benny D115]